MKNDVKHFDPMPYARLRTYGEGTGKAMQANAVARDAAGALLCAPAGINRWQLGFEWDMPRDILGVTVAFAPGASLPTDWHVEYWHYSWPNEQKDRRAGAHKGWLLTDDPFHGRWLAAYGERTQSEQGCAIVFDHIDVNEVLCIGGEYPQNLFLSDDYNAMFRRALKFRIIFEGKQPPAVAGIRLLGDATLTEDACIAYPNATGKGAGKQVAVTGIWNGVLHSGQGALQGSARLAYTRTQGAQTQADQSLLNFAVDGVGFAVRAEDIANGVYMEAHDLLLAPEGMGGDAALIVQRLKGDKCSLYDRVAEHAEQTVAAAMAAVPPMEKNMQPKYGRYVLMGWEGVRQKFALRYNGDIFANKIDQKVSQRDTAKTRWAANELHFRLATGDPPNRHEGSQDTEQSMPDARVPVYETRWLDREIEYCQTSFATLLTPEDAPIHGDEDIMVMSRIRLRNASSETRTAKLFIEVYPGERLHLEGSALLADGRVRPGDTATYGWTVQPYPDAYLRAQFQANGQGTLRTVPFTAAGTTSLSMQPQFGFEGYDRNPVRMQPASSIASAVLYEVDLAPYGVHTIDVILPYPSLSSAEDLQAISARSFDAELARVTRVWHALAARGAHIALPGETKLNAFASAVPWHVVMTAMRDLRTGYYMVPAGTYGYGSCGNEASLQIRMLDYLGYHDYAEKYLETFIASQGQGSMDGNFRSNDGALVANNYGGYSDNTTSLFAYNLDHGYILTCLVDHYRLTGNRAWLARIAPTLVKACDYIFTERKATMVLDDQGEKVSYYGLMPHGHLEDNPEWRCWYAVNAHACGGILSSAEVLAEIAHPEAARIRLAALAYRGDIRESVTRAMGRSPAVPTGNGGYMPHVPTQAEIRGRDWGWFREVAYGPLHLVTGRVLDPDEDMTTWILRDQEDNLFLSRDYGRAVDRETHWFGRGGMTVQSNLLFNDLVYLQRDEPARAIRGLFNNFAQNLYRDVNCFSEHPITDFGKGFGPFFKTPDEAQFINNLRNHLIREDGQSLCLLQGAARGWFAPGQTLAFTGMATYFGRVSLRMAVQADGRQIDVHWDAQWRDTPRKLVLSLRTPDGLTPRKVLLGGADLGLEALACEKLTLTSPAEKGHLTILY
ncbi:MAG: hypothetical protein VB087_04020 [Candidatus Limiplasma sp.]|nr:hypothetical protein [Candidatus Limiplasma sp.]MEA5145623.1 hypothetical protein [Candidatus Limiplasma sp.]